MLLISLSILSSCQDHVQFLPFIVGVLPKIISFLFLLYLVLTGVLACTSRPLFSSFIALQTPRFTWSSLFLFSTGVLSYSFSSVKLLFHILQPTKVLAMFIVPLAERSVLNFVHLRCAISSSFATSQGSLVSLVCQRSNLFYLFPFRFFPVPS